MHHALFARPPTPERVGLNCCGEWSSRGRARLPTDAQTIADPPSDSERVCRAGSYRVASCDRSDVRRCPDMIQSDIERDVAAIDRLDVVHTALKVLRRATGLRIALVARVTEHSWTACAVLDEAGFGLKPGHHLELSTTY